MNRSQSTTVDTGVEYFFNVKLDEDKKVYEWKPLGDDDEGMEEDDEDFISHTLFLKTAVLGADCVKDQSNVVMLESEDGDGNKIEGAICHLNKLYSPMCQLDLSLNGKNGAKFTLVGAGPIYITGNYVQDFPRDDGMMMDNTQTEDESENENGNEMDDSNEKMDEVEEVEDDSEEEETKVTKAKKAAAAKRKATAQKASSKPKQKAKMDTTEEDVDDEEEEDEDEQDDADDDDDDEDYEEAPPKKAAAKKAAPKADAKKGKKAAAPEVTKKTAKKVKK